LDKGIFILLQSEVEIFVLVAFDAASHARKMRPQVIWCLSHIQGKITKRLKVKLTCPKLGTPCTKTQKLYSYSFFLSLSFFVPSEMICMSQKKSDEEIGYEISEFSVFESS
jgi:hypothetical protein